MKELSIFIDESGDFGQTVNQSPYYIVSLVFHDQCEDISENVIRLKRWLAELDFNDEYIHTHPIIRKEYPYNNMTLDERRKILNKMLRFTVGCPVKYFNIVVNKRECSDKHSLSANIAKQLSRFIDNNANYFNSFGRIVVYGNDNERFFFVEENPDGSYTVEGECYIITNEESLKRHKCDVKKEIKNKPIWYYHIDKNRTVIRKEKHISP